MKGPSSPKHMNPSDNGEKRGFFSSLQSGDVAAWAQAGIMATPFLAYVVVYYLKCYAYSRFGVSTTLIAVKLEDVLWLAAGLTLPCVVILIEWAFSTYASRDRVATTILFVEVLLLVVLVFLAVLTLHLSFRAGLFDRLPYMYLLFQMVSLITLYLVSKRSWVFFDANSLQMAVTCLFSVVLFAFAATDHAAYLSFHNSWYQVCDSHNALIIGFDSQGKAIEKQIVSVSDNGICELAPGYRLVEVDEELLHLVQYSHLLVDEW